MQLLSHVRDCLTSQTEKAYLVGGSVRDSLIGRSSKDLDFAISGNPESFGRQLSTKLDGTLIPLDISRGMWRIVVQYANATSTIDLSPLKGSVETDLAQRDFTVNAMAVDVPETYKPPGEWHILDPFGGIQDLRNQTLRVVSDNTFRDDPIRLIRGIRLAAQLGFRIDPLTSNCITANSCLINDSSPERTREEFLAIFSSRRLEWSLRMLSETGLLEAIIPELSQAKGVSQPVEHYWDVYQHSIQCSVMVATILDSESTESQELTESIPLEPWIKSYFNQPTSDAHSAGTLLKVAALLHDIAKPKTKTVEPSGKTRFLGHPTEGARIAQRILHRLKFSGAGNDRISTIIEHHLRPSQLSQSGLLPSSKAIHRFFRDLDDVSIDILFLSMADYLAARGPDVEIVDWKKFCDRITYTLGQKNQVAVARGMNRLITGDDLISIFSLTPGPRFRQILMFVEEAQATGEILTRDDAIDLLESTLATSNPNLEENYV